MIVKAPRGAAFTTQLASSGFLGRLRRRVVGDVRRRRGKIQGSGYVLVERVLSGSFVNQSHCV